jgi:hypothetical protein
MPNRRVSCKANNKQGTPCRAAATASGYCHFHANPGKAAELGRSGGKKNRHVVDDEARPLPPLNSTSNLKDAVGILIGDMHAKVRMVEENCPDDALCTRQPQHVIWHLVEALGS